MRKIVFALSALAFASSAAYADPIADRKALMKERGGIAGQLAPIAKGEKAFDAAVVLTALQALDANAKKFDVEALFPAGSESGGETKASPKIWEDMAGFKAAGDKFAADVAAAVAAPPADLAAFQAQFGAITQNCGACHQAFRM